MQIENLVAVDIGGGSPMGRRAEVYLCICVSLQTMWRPQLGQICSISYSIGCVSLQSDLFGSP